MIPDILCFFLMSYSTIGWAQHIKILDLLQIGDSVLHSTIGSSYVPYYSLDSTSYYQYSNWLKKEKNHSFADNTTKGKFIRASLRYTISYPEIRELSSTLFVLINNDLSVEKFTSDIPDFILENKPSTFITKDDVIVISDSLLKEKGLYIEFYLVRNRTTNSFVWKICNIIRKTNEVGAMGLMEIIEINAYNGEVIRHEVAHFGRVLVF